MLYLPEAKWGIGASVIYDMFYFFNELDLLEIRLEILDAYVDKFILVDFNQTYSGVMRESLYTKNKERYARWNHKIVHYHVDDFPKDTALVDQARHNSNTGAGEDHWIREFYLKERAKDAIASVSPQDQDVVFISDLDEIWNPLTIKPIEMGDKIYRPFQSAHYYYLNNRCDEVNGWTGTVVAKYKNIRHACINDLRTRHKTPTTEIANGGWHFGFLGGVEGAKRKIVDSNHPCYNHCLGSIADRVQNNQDYMGRNFHFWLDETHLPDYLIHNKEKWKYLFKGL